MIRGLYTAASGMLAATVATDTMANNLANVGTVGFKKNNFNYQSFPELMLQRMDGQGQQPVGSIMTGSKIYGTHINFSPGIIQETGNTFDLAIEGDGFFTVKKGLAPGAPEYFTRAGNMMINEQGYLTTSDGYYVQGEQGPIVVNLDQGPYRISPQGVISGQQGVIAELKITRFDNNQALMKAGDTLFEMSAAANRKPAPLDDEEAGFTIHQGRLEQANTNVIAEMVNNIQGLRLYEALQKNIHLHNEALGKAVNEVGKVR